MLTSILENILNSLESIRANKLRSSLSMLGIIIGVSSVIILGAIGNGSSQAIVDQVEEMGTNILTISPGGFGRSQDTNAPTDFLNKKLTTQMGENIDGLDGILGTISSNGQAIYAGNDISVSVLGVEKDFFDVKNIEIASGNNFLQEHIDNLDKVAIIGQDIVTEIFGEEGDPLGKKLKIGNNIFEVIGVLGESSDYSTTVFIPLTTSGVRVTGKKYYSEVIVYVSDADAVTQKEEEIAEFLNSYLDLSEGASEPYRIRNMAEMLSRMSTITDTLTMLLSGIAGISLLVGGIGVMNIMLVSVTERTKEIGIRKAIGAGKSDILLQFLTEAVSISVIGGLIGISLSYMVVGTLNYFSIASIISPDSIVISFLFSLGIGLFFGILPAYKAAKLRPIDALRFE